MILPILPSLAVVRRVKLIWPNTEINYIEFVFHQSGFHVPGFRERRWRQCSQKLRHPYPICDLMGFEQQNPFGSFAVAIVAAAVCVALCFPLHPE